MIVISEQNRIDVHERCTIDGQSVKWYFEMTDNGVKKRSRTSGFVS